MYVLRSDRLRVDVSEPHTAPNVTTRFDRAGFIEEVVLDGIHRFCASEPNNLAHPSSGGRGICNEYKADTDAGVPVGGYFMKPGVGLLLRESDEPYHFMHRYKARPFRVEVSHKDSTLIFVTHPEPCNGFALRQEKRIEVIGDRLEIAIKLENVGEKDFVAGEYCHNFLTINGMSLGPNYKLLFPSGTDRGDKQIEGEMYADGSGFTFSGPLQKPRFFAMEGDTFNLKTGEPLEWTLENIKEGVKVTSREYIRLSRVAIWAADHMFSSECFHAIKLAPGESDKWTRTWTFGTTL